MPIDRFKDGTPSARDKLNAMVDVANSLAGIRGDQYIAVRRTVAGCTISLNLAAVRAGAGVIESVIVRVKKDGVDGGGLPTYSLYALSDVDLATPLATVQTPTDGRARLADLGGLTQAPDGNVEDGYLDSDGYHLITAAETVCASEGGFPWETG